MAALERENEKLGSKEEVWRDNTTYKRILLIEAIGLFGATYCTILDGYQFVMVKFHGMKQNLIGLIVNIPQLISFASIVTHIVATCTQFANGL